MPRKKKQIMLHMHQLKAFIDDRHSFYNTYFKGIDPRFYNFKGVQKAFKVGSAVDYAIKKYYLNLNNGNNIEEGLFNSDEFKTLPTRIDQTIVLALVNGYISRYHSTEETKEYLHSFQIVNHKIPFVFTNQRKLKNKYIIYCSPDLVALTLWYNNLVIMELKTSADKTAEPLDFQTMCYCWGSYRWNFKIPKYVIKRTLMKPKIKQKKGEAVGAFQKRIIIDISQNEDKYFKTSYREINKSMVMDFENYLGEILLELDTALNSKSKYKYYKPSGEYWGN